MYKNVPDIMTFKECQEFLRLGKNSLLYYLNSGELTGFKIGNRWRITKYDAIEFCQRRLN